MKKSITKAIYYYWLVLLIWQNLFNSSLRGMADILIKMILLVFLIIRFYEIGTTRGGKIGIILFSITMLTSFIANDVFSPFFSLSTILFYLFPCLYAHLVYTTGGGITIDEDELWYVNKRIIFVTFLAVLYIFAFDRGQFTTALSATNGYGNELHGFFASMYEFSLYLFYSITCCIKRIDSGYLKGFSAIGWYVLIGLFMLTMVLTFSRTIIACCIVYLSIYSILNRRSSARHLIIFAGVVFAIMCFTIPSLRMYVFRTVWKEGISNSRQRLYEAAIEFYNESSLLHKLIGSGVGISRAYFRAGEGYGSIHNGYLQVLIYYGIIGILWIIAMTIAQLKKIRECFYANKGLAIESTAFLSAILLTMIPSTVIVFNSPIDSFFLTSFFLVIPRYRMNQEINTVRLLEQNS